MRGGKFFVAIFILFASLAFASAGFWEWITGNPVSEGDILGDVNRDGFVDSVDLQIIVDVAWGGYELPEGSCEACADVTSDGVVNVFDITTMRNYIYYGKPFPGTNITNCTDSDGGVNYYKKGIVNFQGQNYVDDCGIEYYCNANQVAQDGSFECPAGCISGQCNVNKNSAYTLKFVNSVYDSGLGYYGSVISVTDMNGLSSTKEVSEGGNFKIIQGLPVKVKASEESFSQINLRLLLKSPEITEVALFVNGEKYVFELISATDTGATIRISNSDGISESKEILEGTEKIVNGLLVEMKTSDEDSSQSSMLADFEVGLFNLAEEKIPCSYDYHCPSETNNFCSEDGRACTESANYECVAGFCEMVSGGAGCTPVCPEGCLNGKCLISNEVCQDLINKVGAPSDFDINGIRFELWNSGSWEGEWWVNGVNEPVNEYYAMFGSYFESSNYYVSYDLIVFDNTNIDAQQIIKERTAYSICKPVGFWTESGEQKVYVCNWDALNERQDLDNYQSKPRQILWAKGNVVVEISTSTGIYLSDEDLLKISNDRLHDFLDTLIDNRGEWLNWDYFDLEYPLYEVVRQGLEQCNSEVPLDICVPCWECKTEPSVCPPHGIKTQTCTDFCCDTPSVEVQKECTPGICNGCMVPKWFGEKWSGNKCIPYGFRFEQETGDFVDQIFEEQYGTVLQEENLGDDGSLVVESDEKAILTLYDKDGNPYVYTLTPGAEVVIDAPGFEEYIKFSIFVNGISYNPDGGSYVDITIKYSYNGKVYTKMNAYCEIDGLVKQQKTPNSQGDWAGCQNNYECQSNICSNGECVEPARLLNDVGAFTKLLVSAACKILHPLSEDNYQSCILDFVGPKN